jgi:nucleotide-binding universal stress UspA family protein
MARRFSARVDVLNVVADPPMVAPESTVALARYSEAAGEYAANAISELVGREIADDVEARAHTVRSRSTAHAIADFARSEKAELIVISTHGETGLQRLVFGSVAEKVVRLAPCLVLTVPMADDGA